MTSPASRSDTELLRAWSVDRCEGSFRELAGKYLDLVRGVALRRTGDPELAGEIAQTVFILTARKAGRLQASPSLAPWLHHCAWCETTSALRRESIRRRRMSDYTQQMPSPSPEPVEDDGIHQALPHLDEALQALGESDRRIVLMRFYEGHGLKDIASALGRTEAAVRKQCQRALEKLERRFQRKGLPVSAAVLAAGLGGMLTQPSSTAATVATATATTAVNTASTAAAATAASAAARISAKTAAATAGGGTGAGTAAGAWLLSFFMNTKAASILATAALLSVPLGWQWRRAELQQQQIARLEAEAAAWRRQDPAFPSTGGRGLAPGSRPLSKASGNRAGQQTDPASSTDASAEEEAWRQRLADPAGRPAALTDRAQAILGEKSPARRLRLFSAFMDELQPGDYEAINAGFARQDQQGRLFAPEYELFLATAGAVDGQATMESIFRWYHASGGTPTGAQHGAMSSWAMEQPAKAIEWWNAQEEGAVKNELAKSLISGLALKDVNLAWRCLNEFPVEDRAPFMGSLVRQQITGQGAEGAAAWLASLEAPDHSDTGPLKQAGFDSLYQSLVNLPPDKKSEFVGRFAHEPWMGPTSYAGEVAGQWAVRDGPQAVGWAAGLPEALRGDALLPALFTWNERQPQAFSDWKAAHQADPDYQKPLAVLDEMLRAREAAPQSQTPARPPAGPAVPGSAGAVKEPK